MRILKRLLDFIASRMLLITVVCALLVISFYLAMNTANIWVLIDDGLDARAGVVLMGEDADKLMGFECGADDYVTKPFGAAELLARIRSALRNCSHSADSGKLPGGRFSVQDLEILYDARQVFIKGREIKLTQTEYNIVALLSEHCGKMMTYSAIIKGVWGYPDEGSVKKLQVNMANIRKKFGVKPGEATYITNELGVGYRMNSD